MQLHISRDLKELSKAVTEWLVEHIQETLKQQDRYTLALSGGSTPKMMNHLLSTEFRDKVDWSRLHIFFGDERFVPFADERNNAKMAFDTLLNNVPIPREQIHIMPTENISPEEAAAAYEEKLKEYFTETSATFDCILLGMGDDGHTLSLFPGKTEVIHETKKWCTSLWLEEQDMYRITLTHPIANRATSVVFLTAGDKKAQALREILQGMYNPDKYPSQIIKPLSGGLHWFIDEAAAEGL
ncbi:MAG TPA: 6-phosphogluconolactonase [Chitinophagaceae bacterium]|nr:6-phosphogluconolactonase [Chitinophagaceae bacterium]